MIEKIFAGKFVIGHVLLGGRLDKKLEFDPKVGDTLHWIFGIDFSVLTRDRDIVVSETL